MTVKIKTKKNITIESLDDRYCYGETNWNVIKEDGHYIIEWDPEKNTGLILTSEELKALAKKLDKLNK